MHVKMHPNINSCEYRKICFFPMVKTKHKPALCLFYTFVKSLIEPASRRQCQQAMAITDQFHLVQSKATVTSLPNLN